MTSVLNVDTIAAKNGTSPVALTKQSAAKMFIDAEDGLASILKSLNVSSLDDDGTGDGGVNLVSSMDGVNYAVSTGMHDNGALTVVKDCTVTDGTQAASSFDFETAYVNASTNRTNEDTRVHFTIHGDLA
jgi:hypothetical protein